jgi:dihydrofolate reductase
MKMTAGVKDLAVISALCRSNGIGLKGDLPWRLRKEMAYFTRITSTARDDNCKNAVIMGRKTWDSIPDKYRPLEGRINVVLSKTLTVSPKGADYLFSSLEEAVSILSSVPSIDRLFVIGGSSVYEEALKSSFCSKVYLTRIDADFECDTFFPHFDDKDFLETKEESVPTEIQEEKGIRYTYHVYSRVK